MFVAPSCGGSISRRIVWSDGSADRGRCETASNVVVWLPNAVHSQTRFAPFSYAGASPSVGENT